MPKTAIHKNTLVDCILWVIDPSYLFTTLTHLFTRLHVVINIKLCMLYSACRAIFSDLSLNDNRSCKNMECTYILTTFQLSEAVIFAL